MTIVNYDTPPLLPFFVFIEKRLGQHCHGRVVEQGTHVELVTQRGYYYKLIQNQLDLAD